MPELQPLPPFNKGFTFLAFTCARASADAVASFFEDGIRRDYPDLWKFYRAPVQLPYPEPKPGGAHYPEIAIWRPSCHEDRCVLTANRQDGFHRFLAHYLHEMRAEFTTIRATASGERWPVFTFEHHDTGIERRCVQVLKDDPKWQFFQSGSALPFEDTAMYSARRVRDRLTAELIVRFLTALV